MKKRFHVQTGIAPAGAIAAGFAWSVAASGGGRYRLPDPVPGIT